MSSLSLTAKVVATVALIGSTTAVAGLGTFGTFTDTTSASTPVDAGVVDLNLGDVGSAANRLTVAATDIVPGDTIQRGFTLSGGSSTSPLGSVTLTSTASPSSALDTDATNGLQMVIDKCSIAWVESATPPYAYTCAGVTTTVVASRAVIGSGIALTGLDSLSTAGATDQLRLTLTLPSTAGNTFQGLASTVGFTFTGTQRNATSK